EGHVVAAHYVWHWLAGRDVRELAKEDVAVERIGVLRRVVSAVAEIIVRDLREARAHWIVLLVAAVQEACMPDDRLAFLGGESLGLRAMLCDQFVPYLAILA